MDLYDKMSEIAKLYAEKQLRSLYLCDRNDFPNYIMLLRQLWQKVNSIDGAISNTIFRSILLGSLSTSWSPIVATCSPRTAHGH